MILRSSIRVAPLAILLVLTARFAAGANQTDAGEHPLSLADAVTLALEHNEGIVIERESLVSAEAGVTGAKGAYDPLLAANASWERTSPPVNSAFSGAPAGQLSPTNETSAAGAGVTQLLPTGASLALRGSAQRDTTSGVFGLLSPAYSTDLGVELRQPLLRDRAIDPARFGIRVAAADRDKAAAGLRQEVTETVAAVEHAYWTLTAARREVSVREEAVRLAEEQQGQTDARIQAGTAPETEAAQPRAELERRRNEMLASREAESRAENALKLLILGDSDVAAWGERLVPSDPVATPVTPVDVPAAMERALASRPELAAGQATIERRRAEAALAHDGVRPALDAVVSYDRYGLAGTRNPASSPAPGASGGAPRRLEGDLGDSLDVLRSGDLDDARVALVLSLPIGNRQARSGAAIADSATRQAEADLSRSRKQVRIEVLDAAAALDTAGQRIDAARAAREAAEVQLSAERDRYGAGISTNFLVLTRQNDLASARLDEIAAQTDYRQAVTEMARATGALLGQHGIEVDEDNHSASRKAP